MNQIYAAIVVMTCVLPAVSHVAAQTAGAAELWLTTADRSSLFAEQALVPFAREAQAAEQLIVISEGKQFQSVDGFGFALTGGSAELLMRMSEVRRKALLKELFG